MYTLTHTHTHTYKYIHIYTNIYTYIHVNTHIYIYIQVLGECTETNGHALPAGWTEHLDEKRGLTYYYAASTGSTVWQRPTKAATEAGSKMAAALDDEL
jgi:hypothetical protein